MIAIKSIASSSGANAYRVDDGLTPLLLECGWEWKKMRQYLNFTTSDLGACLVSHYHKDHSRAILDVLKGGIDVYASLETLAAYEIDHYRAHVVRPTEQFEIGSWKIKPFSTVHDAPGSLGFILQSKNGGRLLFLTDTAYIKYKFPGLTHIMIEANFSLELLNFNMLFGLVDPFQKARLLKTHMSIERVIDFLNINDLSKVVEIHLLHMSNSNSDAEMFGRMVRQATGKATYIAEA